MTDSVLWEMLVVFSLWLVLLLGVLLWIGARQQRRQDAQVQAWLAEREHRRRRWHL